MFVALLLLCLSATAYSVEPWTGLTRKPEYRTKYFLHTGFTFDAVMRTGIFSYNLASPVICEIEYDIVYLDRVMIPKKSKLIGYASVLKSMDRVNVYFNTLVFPDGSEIRLDTIALNIDGSAGIPGVVKRYKELIPVKVVLNTLADAEVTGIGGKMLQELGKQGSQDISVTPTYSITVKKDMPIMVFVTTRVEY